MVHELHFHSSGFVFKSVLGRSVDLNFIKLALHHLGFYSFEKQSSSTDSVNLEKVSGIVELSSEVFGVLSLPKVLVAMNRYSIFVVVPAIVNGQVDRTLLLTRLAFSFKPIFAVLFVIKAILSGGGNGQQRV